MCFVPQRRAIFDLSSPRWLHTRRFSPKCLEKHSVSRLFYLFARLDFLSSLSLSLHRHPEGSAKAEGELVAQSNSTLRQEQGHKTGCCTQSDSRRIARFIGMKREIRTIKFTTAKILIGRPVTEVVVPPNLCQDLIKRAVVGGSLEQARSTCLSRDLSQSEYRK